MTIIEFWEETSIFVSKHLQNVVFRTSLYLLFPESEHGDFVSVQTRSQT